MKEGWEYKKLGDAATFINGFAFKPTQWGESGIPIIRIQNLNNPVAPFNYFDGDIPIKYLVKKGDILISWSASLGAYEWTGENAYLNQHIFKVIFDKADIDKHFLKYAVTSKLSEMDKDAHGATMRHIVKKDFDNTIIPFPPLSEQQHIVEELDLLSSIIEKKKAQLKELDNLAQSLFYEMFGSPTGNEKGFPLLTVNDVIRFEGGSQPPKTSFEYTPTPDNIRLIQIRDYKTDAYITYVPKKLARRFCDEDDIMIGRYGPPIFQILKGISGAYNVALMKAVPLKGNKEFIRAYLKQKCLLHYLETFSRRVAGQDGIQMDKLKAYPFPYPPIDLQNLFASKIEAIEHQKEVIKQSIMEVETLFNSRMDYYFN